MFCLIEVQVLESRVSNIALVTGPVELALSLMTAAMNYMLT